MAPTRAQRGNGKRVRAESDEEEELVHEVNLPRTIPERVALGQAAIGEIYASPRQSGGAWTTTQQVMNAAQQLCNLLVPEQQVIDRMITDLRKAGWDYNNSAWEAPRKAPNSKKMGTMLEAAQNFFKFYAGLAAPAAPVGPPATERETRLANDEDATDAALLAAALAASQAAERGPAAVGGGGAGPSGVANGRPPSGGAPGVFGGGPPGAFGGARNEPPESMPSLAQLRANAGLMYGVNTIRQGGSAEELDLQTAPGGSPEIDFSELHGGSDGIELDRDNRIVLRKGKKAPTDKETFVEALKAELRVKKAARDPHYLEWCEYVEKLRTFLDQDTPFKEVIAIDRKVRTRWGAQGAALYNEDMVDLVATMHTLLKLRADRTLHHGYKTGGDGGGGGGGGGGGDGRYVGERVDDQKPKRVHGGKESKLCWAFNDKGCNTKSCKFLHECDSCGSTKHGSSACGSNK